MKNRFLLAAALVLAAAAAACGEDTVAHLDLPAKPHHSKTTAAQDDGDDDDSNATQASTSTSTKATAPTTAPAAPAKPAGLDPFAGAPAFAEITPATDSSFHHLGETSNAGKDCLGCHTGEGAPQFALAGTIANPSETTGAQVRIVGPDGAEVASVGTDSVGNFWLLGATKIPAGSWVGIRDGATTRKMGEAISTGACNQSSCHDGSRPISLAK